MTRWISLILMTSFVSHVAGQGVPKSDSQPVGNPRAVGTPALLGVRLAEVAFDETPLEQAIDWLGAQVGADFVARWPVLEESGITRDAPVTLKIHNLRFSQALWLILGEVGGTDLRLAYRAEGSLVIISTAADLERELITRVYDVSDLLVRVRQFKNCPQVDVTQAVRGGTLTLESSTDAEEANEEKPATGAYEESVEGLLEIIQHSVEPDSWEANGGFGTVQGYGKRLIVRNTIRVHQALAGLGITGE